MSMAPRGGRRLALALVASAAIIGQITACTTTVEGRARAPWDVDPATGLSTFTTRGNNAVDSEAWTDPLGPGAFGHQPVAADRCPGNRRWIQLVYDAYLLMPIMRFSIAWPYSWPMTGMS